MSYRRELRNRHNGQHSKDLAAEWRELIRDTDNGRDSERKPAEGRQHQVLIDSEVEMLVSTLHRDFQEANAELIAAVRILRSLAQDSESRILSQLERTEEALFDEMRLIEKRIRGDIQSLRRDLSRLARGEYVELDIE